MHLLQLMWCHLFDAEYGLAAGVRCGAVIKPEHICNGDRGGVFDAEVADFDRNA